jgi:uncharacterized protein YdeI (YjbR/CyaY-like superfamily)
VKTQGTVDDWFEECERWRDQVALLREIVLGLGLGEALKWGQPTYDDAGRNVLLISTRKEGPVVSFFRGALLEHPDLVSPGQASRHVRYLRFSSVEEIALRRPALERLVREAVQLARSGERVEPPPEDIEYVEELRQRLASDEAFRVAFEALTPGRRRGYNLHFGQPKQASTREARVARCTDRVLAGKGLQDCVCGHSKRPPRCDGTHKHLGSS